MSATARALAASPPAKPVGAVTAALAILRCLGRHEHSLRLLDLVHELGLNTSTILNILRTLEYEGLVSFDRRTKHYALADGLAHLAAPVLERHDTARRFALAMDAAAHDLGATVALWRRIGDDLELVQVGESSAVMRIAYTVGRRLPTLLGAMGRLVAGRGDWSPADLRAGFDRLRWVQPPEYQTWLAEIATARQTGAAVDSGNVNRGVLGVAVPVESTGPLIHIIAATMFETEHGPDIPTIIDRLREVATFAAV
jgi:DNA-binding IclR family transcriptional regulator